MMQVSLWARSDGTDETVVLEHRHEELSRNARRADPFCLVRIHSACLTGDAFGSLKCDCGLQLEESLRRIGSVSHGLVLYPLAHEGRGIGLLDKLRAYALQDQGLDTFEANEAIGAGLDDRDYSGVVSILNEMGIGPVRLLTRNPNKVASLRKAGIDVVGVESLDVPPNVFNDGYLRTKRRWFDRIQSKGNLTSDGTAKGAARESGNG